ncbi:MAG: ABC transporter ATP-binding protein, partial [Candidatus Syntrophonatronum acetioxidans]
LSFQAGEYTAIIGQSGSGKSTLLNIISTLDRPSGGTISVEGRDLTTLSDDGLARFRSETMGFIFQFHYLLPEFNALENVLIPHWLAHGKPSAETVDLARELIDRVGVSDRMYNKSTDLSGGQQQRIAIARALINRPQIILADEPTGSLDSKTTLEVNRLMREINEEYNTTFIVVTHDRHIAAECDRVVELVDGRVERDYLTKGLEMEEKWNDLCPAYCFKAQGLVEG